MSRLPDPPLKILLLSDGRPGHYNLSEGIVAAISRLRALEVARLEVKRPHWVPARVLSTLVNTGMPATRILKRIYGLSLESLGQPDLIVSAGGNTLAANVAASEITGAANVFYGSLRRYDPEDFTLAMTSYSADAIGPNRLMWLKPSSLDVEDLEVTQRPGPQAASEGARGRTFGLIIGGDSGTVAFSPDDWDRLLSFIQATFEDGGGRWIVANSPRTPSAISDRFAALMAVENSPVSQFLDVRSAGPGTLGAVLAGSEAVVCTADSSTMLSEAVWMQRRVVAVSPVSFSLPDNENDYRLWLEKQGWARQLPIGDLTPASFETALKSIVPMQDNPLDALAAELARRLPI
jgi:mitochondrial fission protein ELM1